MSQEPTVGLDLEASSSRRASWWLLGTTVLWGLSFPLSTHWQQLAGQGPGGAFLSALVLIALRTLIGWSILAVWEPRLFWIASPREWMIGSLLGFLNFVGVFLQTVAQATTSPALSGFITSLASAWVPLIAFALFKVRVARAMLFGIVVSVAGAGILQMDPNAKLHWGGGEMLTLLCSIVFALMIVLLDHFGKEVKSDHLTISFIGMTGIPAMVVLPFIVATGDIAPVFSWIREIGAKPLLWVDLMLLSCLCTVLAYRWMVRYQPQVPAARAALIYLVEPIWAACFSLMLGFDSFTPRLLVGGGLIVIGNLIVELPRWIGSDKNPGEAHA